MKEKLKTFVKAFLWGLLVILFPVASGAVSAVAKLDTVPTLFLQGGFMVSAAAIPLILVLRNKLEKKDIGFGKFDTDGCKKALYFVPALAVYIPVAVSGFYIKSVPYVLGCLFLYLFVGFAEEIYFRGIVPSCLGKAFSRRGVIILSTVIFGTGHLASAFNGGGALETALTVLNAYIFGWMAIEIVMLSGNIAVTVFLHFLFDFETKIIAMSGAELALAEGVRGTIMFAIALWLAFVIRNAGKAKIPEEQRKRKRKRRIIAGAVCGALILAAVVTVTALTLYGRSQMKKIPEMSFEDCLAYTLGDSVDGVITVGIIRDGKASYTVYGRDGKALPNELHTYEIGSLTKTFTAALVQRAVADGKIRLDGTLDEYLTLPGENAYPTITELLTHTSGYKGFYLEEPSTGNFFAGRNDFYGITDDMIQSKLGALHVEDREYPFVYSNFGYAVLGRVLESVYGIEYTALVNDFAAELGLPATRISDGGGDLSGYWDWTESDAYVSAGALVSNIEDMLKYAQYQLDAGEPFGECHKAVKKIDASSDDNKLMNINTDSIGMAWITDSENGIVWHNGGTDNFNCYLGFSPERNAAVVVLSNLAPSYRIPATVIGVKLLTENIRHKENSK